MLLHDLLNCINPGIDLHGLPNTRVCGVKEDSRLVQPGDLFVARCGAKSDGRAFLADARDRGAVAAVVQAADPGCTLPQVVAADPAGAASRLAHFIYRQPSRALSVLGVTGTNGKTTTTYLIRHLLRKFGQRCGMIGTVQIDDGRQQHEATMTTPSATEIAALLATMRDSNCRACAIEVSSHALDQGRVAGVHFAGAAFTNLTGDHLDYHKSMQNYADAKATLFRMLDSKAVAVVNDNDPWSQHMIRHCPAKIIRFGFENSADYRAEEITASSHGTRFRLCAPDGAAGTETSLIGRHNIENVLTAVALVGQTGGYSVHQLAEALADADGAPGRLQQVRVGQPFAVLVDYAHTDDALENVLTALRPLTGGKLRVLFGCGGDRDRSKRARMAAVAQRLADVVYVTSDNPRTEMPLAIITDIVAGFSADYRNNAIIEPDRRCAIEQVLAGAGRGDVVLIAGKGHENYQIIGTIKHHFDDAEEATRVLSAKTRAA